MKIMNGKYEIKAEPNQFILREYGKSKTGKPTTTDRYYATLDGLAYRLCQIETRDLLNEKDWRSLDALGKAVAKLEKTLIKEIKGLKI